SSKGLARGGSVLDASGRRAVSDTGRAGGAAQSPTTDGLVPQHRARGDRAGRETGLRFSYARSNGAGGEFNWLPQTQRQRHLEGRLKKVSEARLTRFEQIKWMGRGLAREGCANANNNSRQAASRALAFDHRLVVFQHE